MTMSGDTTGNSATGPLAGIRIVDLTHMLAGPYCTWLLGALGAEVTKVEFPGRGDFTRGVGPFLGEESIYFMSVNRNKRSVTLNLRHPEGKAALLRLVERADVFIENNRPGAMARLGLGYAELAAVNPRIVYASVSGFGQTGPYSSRPAFDAVIQAMAGTMSITGEKDGGPVRAGMSLGDIGGSLFAAVGILAALQERQRTGRGKQIDIAMLDAQVAMLENAMARYLNTGEVPKRMGSRHPLIAPFQAFETADFPIVVCVDTEPQWARMCEAIGRPDLGEDRRFADGAARMRNYEALEPILAETFRERSSAEWLSALEEADVPVGPINDIAQIAKDPQIAARGMVVEVGGGKFVRQPVHLTGENPSSERPAPLLGEHTDEILAEIGYGEAEIARLRSDGAI